MFRDGWIGADRQQRHLGRGACVRPFFESHYRPLCEALCLLTGDPYEAEELAQGAMTRALERWERIAAMNLNRDRSGAA